MRLSVRKVFSKNFFSAFLSRNVNSLCLSKSHRNNMEKAHYRYVCGEESFHFSFLFGMPAVGAPRQYNLMRKSDETVGTFLSRVIANVEKATEKKRKRKKKTDAVTEEGGAEPIVVQLFQHGKPISNEAVCVEVIKPENDTELHVVGSVFKIVVNAPWISNMILPSSILAGFPVYPLKYEGFFLNKDKSLFEWHVGKFNSAPTNMNWEKVGEGFTFYPTSDHVGKRLRLTCTPVNDSLTGPTVEAMSSTAIEAGPGLCPFENRHKFTQSRLSGDRIRVVTYNLLADLYCDSEFSRTELFPYCPPYALQIDYRKQLFLKEIEGYNADIICLQEVDTKIFDHDLRPVLGAKLYQGVFKRKGGQVAEGLACFFRSDRFRLVEEKSIILGEELQSPVFKEIWSLIESNEPFVKRLQPRTTAVHATILQSLDNPTEIIVVGNTHFYFQPDSDHIRVMQGGLSIMWLNNIIDELNKNFLDKRISLILCGDFNSVPSCGVYKLFTTGYVPSDFIDWRSNESEAVTNVTLKQSNILASACGTPEFTNYTVGFADCLDYIFYQKDTYEVIQVIPLPSVEELSQHTAMPSVVFPSDHVSLAADLQFIRV